MLTEAGRRLIRECRKVSKQVNLYLEQISEDFS